jgi:hypothetical protein
MDTTSWANHDTVKEWWMSFMHSNSVRRKSLVSLILLLSWEIWSEHNARVFHNVATLHTVVVPKIRGEMALCSLAEAKNLGLIMPRE